MDAAHPPRQRHARTKPALATVLRSATRRTKIAALLALAALTATCTLLAPPFTRPAAYFQFADARTLLGVPHFMDVASSLPWLVVGTLGLLFVARTPARQYDSPFADGQERTAFGLLFSAIALVALGSGYFHLAPSPATLLWDRLPMAVAFMSLFAIVLRERIGGPVARGLTVPLVALGVGSVLHWHYTEMLGRGDERLYALVQFFPMIALPIILLWFPAATSRTRDLFLALGFYAVSKVFELTDGPVFALTNGLISGHTIKHACGFIATIWLLCVMSPGPSGAVGRGSRAAATSASNRSCTVKPPRTRASPCVSSPVPPECARVGVCLPEGKSDLVGSGGNPRTPPLGRRAG